MRTSSTTTIVSIPATCNIVLVELVVLVVLAVLVVLWAHRPRAPLVGLLVGLLAGLLAPCWLCWLCLGRIGLGRFWCVCWLACSLACWLACLFLRTLSRSA